MASSSNPLSSTTQLAQRPQAPRAALGASCAVFGARYNRSEKCPETVRLLSRMFAHRQFRLCVNAVDARRQEELVFRPARRPSRRQQGRVCSATRRTTPLFAAVNVLRR
jgi:hypothetical protein